MAVGLRIDVDSIADARSLPLVTQILEEIGLKATFFISVGPDKSGRNLPKYMWKPLKEKSLAVKRYGIRNLLLGLTPLPPRIEDINMKFIIKKGHEVGLHGYDHYEWIKRLQYMDWKEIKLRINKGIDIFRKMFGFSPRSFASPGFYITEEYFKALEVFRFNYASDVIGANPHYPMLSDRKFRTLQLPVTIKSIFELRQCGKSDKEILRMFKEKKDNYATFYFHPSYEALFERDILNKILELDLDFITLGEIARDWIEDSPNI
jgi:undecaprenyl phosphate-alpha-L-ara4FN deformylase